MDVCKSLTFKALKQDAPLPNDIRWLGALEGREWAKPNCGAAGANGGGNSIGDFPGEARTVFRASAVGICALVDVIAMELVEEVAVLERKLVIG